ncbi:membrane integrity-associated transporter subunit PqiC [Sulfurimonas sp. SAG-AH-194-C20]|nr:ABC-type transport auxiliary lipoprotein family protein [Sulfurimonas sp. SAG-AH-194-C20]MDF1878899.1 membrane integrity-associated transporter subunit PqiC [Sulfurimonas sp. SAG-AH-194-C20]
MKIVWIVLAIFLVGCTTTQPHVSKYNLEPKIQKQEYVSTSCKEKSLKVGQVFSSNSLMSQKMNYVQGKYEESSFTQSEWARTPNRAISDALVKSVRASELFANSSTFKSRAKTDLLLETHLETFMQYFEKEAEQSSVVVVMTLNLLNTKDSKSISHATFNVEIETLSADAKGGVVALNNVLSKVLLKTNSWLDGVCK